MLFAVTGSDLSVISHTVDPKVAANLSNCNVTLYTINLFIVVVIVVLIVIVEWYLNTESEEREREKERERKRVIEEL